MSVIWSGITEEGAVVPVQVTEEGKVVAVGDGPEGEFVKKAGDNMTGDLTLDTDKITLNAADGSITATGKIETTGPLIVDRDNATQSVLVGRLGGSETLEIRADGSATFATSSGNSKIVLNADGSATFASNKFQISASGTQKIIGTGLSSSGMFHLQNDGVWKAIITGAGRLTLGGNASSPGTSNIVLSGEDGSASFAEGKCGFTSSGELFFTSRNTRYKLVVQNELCVAEPYTREMELKEKKDQFIAGKRETKPADPQGEVTMDIDNSSLNQD